jgi:DNA replication and repair protein RecF
VRGWRRGYNADVQLTSLELANFRSYRELDLTLPAGLTIAHGTNGAGKSNLLEAAYLLAIGKSYRASVERELVAWEAAAAGGQAIIGGRVIRVDGEVELRVGLDCAGSSNVVAKRIRVNGVARRAADMVGALGAVLFTAEDIDLVFGSPQGRRRYLDIMLAQFGGHYVQALQRYQRVLTQRNALLRAIREGRSTDTELAYWDDSLCTEGATVLGERYDAMQRLAPLVAEAFDRLEAIDSLGVTYAATVPFEERPTAETFASALERVRGAERGAGMTLVGPHRDDLKITMNGVEMAKHASRGQARLAALGLRVAEARLMEERRNDPPVVLLDDVLSELDDRRRGLVLEEALRNHQTIVTTADLAQVPGSFLDGAHRLRVEDRTVVRETA